MKSDFSNFKIGTSQVSFPLDAINSTTEKHRWSKPQITSHLKTHPSIFLSKDNKLAAFILYLVVRDVLEICYLETLPPFRRQGLMTFLMEELISLNINKKFWLDVREENLKAQGLYKKMGFKNSGLRKGYYRDGEDCLLLERKSEA